MSKFEPMKLDGNENGLQQVVSMKQIAAAFEIPEVLLNEDLCRLRRESNALRAHEMRLIWEHQVLGPLLG